MPAATCHPGQDDTSGCYGAIVAIRPLEGDFGTTRQDVKLRAWSVSDVFQGECGLPILPDPVGWDKDRILGQIPANPGSGDDGETFSVQVGTAFETAHDVIIVGPLGNYPDPPMHTAAAQKTEEGLELVPLSGGFGQGGDVLLVASGGSVPLSVHSWSEDKITVGAPVPSIGEFDLVRILVLTKEGEIFHTPAVPSL